MSTQEIRVPDIGDFKDVKVVELLVKVGDSVAASAPLLVLETDKATMEVPTSCGGIVRELRVAVGDLVSQDASIALIELTEPSSVVMEAARPPSTPEPAPAPTKVNPALQLVPPPVDARRAPSDAELPDPATSAGESYRPVRASPALRRYARSLGVDLAQLSVDGQSLRVTREDVESYVRSQLKVAASGRAEALAEAPRVDYAKFGPIEQRALPRIRRVAGANLVRSWATIPHVTNFDEADVSALERFRMELNAEPERGAKVTQLAFLLKACAAALQKFPELRSSLQGDSLIVKNYFHIGFAADTKDGLVVPVIRDVDRKSVSQLAAEAADLAAAARAGRLGLADMQGGCFSVSSLGGIGGTHFTPIINAPEVAILGAGRIIERVVLDGDRARTRKILPLSLSWDHRALDGALAARFLVQLCKLLADMRRVLL
jgi:pyruvate dehydrogenase E2 component (dihydrolipoamide acetyltransferase)